MSKKVLAILIIIGIVFVGSTTYALFNENLVFDVASDIQINEASSPNDHPNIQNNQPMIIANNGNSNLSFNNVANIVLNDVSVINDSSVSNDNEIDVNKKIETRREALRLLDIVDDPGALDGGYVLCSDCGNFIPLGKVSGVLNEKCLCHCPDVVVADVPYVYTEESVLYETSYTDYINKLEQSKIHDNVNQQNIENTNSYVDSESL